MAKRRCPGRALRAHLAAVLPDYMVPGAFVTLAALPLTPNGKLDRKALPAPEPDALLRQAYAAPQGAIEETLAAIWGDILRVAQVGRHDHFFDLGGHSLLAVQMIERLRRAGLQADVRGVFHHPVLCDLALDLGSEQRPEFVVPANRIPDGCAAITPDMLPLVQLGQEDIDRIVRAVPGGAPNVQDIYPLAPLQEGILFHHQMSRHGDVYVLPTLLGLETRFALDKLIEALRAVIGRHDILRSAVLWRGLPEPVQVVYRDARLAVQSIELDPAREALAQFKERMAPQALSMDLEQAPLVRLQVAADPHSQRWLALLQLHHIASDHVSLEVLIAEVFAHLAGDQQRLPVPIGFRNFVAQALAGRQRWPSTMAFFREMLGDIDEPTAPFGLLDVQGDGATSPRRVGPWSRRWRDGSAAWPAAWGLVRRRCSTWPGGRSWRARQGREDVVFGTVLFGRMQGGDGADRAMGLFINTLPLRLSLGDKSVRQMVRYAHQEIVELLAHEQASLALAQRCSGVAAGTPLFSAMFNYRHSVPAPAPEGARTPEGAREGIAHARRRRNAPTIRSPSRSTTAGKTSC